MAILDSHNNAAEMFEAYIAAVFFSADSLDSTKANAFAILNEWLEPIMDQLAAEEQHDGVSIASDDSQLDRDASGSKSRLHEMQQRLYITELNYQEKSMVPGGAKGTQGLRWKVSCSARYNGLYIAHGVVRDTKKKAAEVAAYLVLNEIKDTGFRMRLGRR
ncbi:hypothetical protein BD324DRAFT_679449 [Kockovaella imperatae]|uniref:Uncharacterized protein n=1 Tax=Kockovaella imperatae TaxID=4999 RepID=A0A1Y1UN35_9TREE|nr:hypothetical protein BD324DRAFT_679449 [Kockovaella imperatae]ORX38927.1 hypothetical protein BD324DRAFT_679449 [Kockovaella imperatae]